MAFKIFVNPPAAFLTAGLIAVLINVIQSSTAEADTNPGFGKRCDPTKCAKSLRCTDRICKCINPDYEIYDSSSAQCRSIVGTKCGVDKRVCVHGADCMASKCRCKAGYVSTKQRTCEKSYGLSCIHKDDICAAPFVCREGKCGCRNADDIHSNTTRMCHSPVGYPCLSEDECVSGSSCVIPSADGVPYNKGTCKCNDGFKLGQSSDYCVSTACKSNFFRPVTEVTNETAFISGYYEGDKTQYFICRVKNDDKFGLGIAHFEIQHGWSCTYAINGKLQVLDNNGFDVLAKRNNGTELSWVTGNHTSGIPEQGILADGKNHWVVRCKTSFRGKERFVPGEIVQSHPRRVMWGYITMTHICDNYEVLTCLKAKK